MTKNTILLISILTIGGFLLQSCGGSSSNVINSKGEPIEFRYASNIKMEEYDGFTFVKLRNPWDTLKTLQRLILLENGQEMPDGFSDATVIRVPLKNSLVYSSVHNSLISELGKSDAIAGICDKEYIVDEKVKEGLQSGRIKDCGSSLSPNLEKIIQLSPDAVLLSPYENGGGESKINKFGIPIIECADYMEPSPLGRAEWMKFYGRLYDRASEADSLFSVTENEYQHLADLAKRSTEKPKVLFDRIYGQSWSVPGRKSTVGILINDAGGKNPFDKYDIAGSVQLSPEKVVHEAGEADIWLIRYAREAMTLKDLKKEKPLYGLFKAYNEGKVYGSETINTNLFDDQAFHPQWVLRDMIRIIHPEIEIEEGRRYYEKIKDAD